MKIFRVICLCGLFLLAASSWCFADQDIFSNLGPGGTYDQNNSWTIGTPPASGAFIQGDEFSPSITATLVDIEIALSHVSGSGNIYIALYNDNSGSLGALLESWTLDSTLLPTFGDSNNSLAILFPGVIPPVLTQGSNYWLIASAADDTTWDTWNYSAPQVLGNHYQNGTIFSGGEGAFRVRGAENAQVPEPATMLLLGLGLVGLAGIKRKL